MNDISLLGEDITIGAVMQDKNDLVCTYAEINDKNNFFLFNDPTDFENPDSIALWHKLITNFIDVCKDKSKSIKEKTADKHLLGLNKVVFHDNDGNKGYYKIK